MDVLIRLYDGVETQTKVTVVDHINVEIGTLNTNKLLGPIHLAHNVGRLIKGNARACMATPVS